MAKFLKDVGSNRPLQYKANADREAAEKKKRLNKENRLRATFEESLQDYKAAQQKFKKSQRCVRELKAIIHDSQDLADEVRQFVQAVGPKHKNFVRGLKDYIDRKLDDLDELEERAVRKQKKKKALLAKSELKYQTTKEDIGSGH